MWVCHACVLWSVWYFLGVVTAIDNSVRLCKVMWCYSNNVRCFPAPVTHCKKQVWEMCKSRKTPNCPEYASDLQPSFNACSTTRWSFTGSAADRGTQSSWEWRSNVWWEQRWWRHTSSSTVENMNIQENFFTGKIGREIPLSCRITDDELLWIILREKDAAGRHSLKDSETPRDALKVPSSLLLDSSFLFACLQIRCVCVCFGYNVTCKIHANKVAPWWRV